MTTNNVERILAPYGATVHSVKRGALRQASELLDAHGMDPHVIEQLTKHVDPFYLLRNMVPLDAPGIKKGERGGQSTIKRWRQQTRIASAEEETIIILLQQVELTLLNIGWIFSLLDGDVLRRFKHNWSLLRLPLRSQPRKSSRAIPVADAALLRDAGVITDASSLKTGSRVLPFSVIETKPPEKRLTRIS
ncbi:hypothetical protein LSM04_006326 [Trypanosoma melophagium]|uniref:uncharacterized protein n=1 Tax=Trypanosoma melophagium TaxID=715481 RepID=UPI00351A4E18|nr:hypothetical protein LSM04_006326 [Trypanosoma melophagium]